MTLVAVSASYGALGSRIAPALAERLGVPFLDRAVSMAGAVERVRESDTDTDAEDVGESRLDRILRGFIGGDAGTAPAPVPADVVTPDELRRSAEDALCRQASAGHGVILGRGAVVVLRDDPRAMRVRLDGPPELRARRAAELEGVDDEAAARALRHADRVHAAYLRDLYGARIDDPRLYHLVLDTTAVSVEDAVELLATAARAFNAPAAMHMR